MKLNYKKTIFVGFAFFLITAFWQAYDTIIPKILTDKFGMSQSLSGVIMAADNVLALFMLPLFGTLSDRCKSRRGRRTPFILAGTVCAAALFVVLSFADDLQLRALEPVAVDNPTAQETLWDADLIASTPDGVEFDVQEEFTREEFAAIGMTEPDGSANPDYTNYVVPARQAYAAAATADSHGPLIFFVVVLLGVLISMATFRSPAVALMPDVTIKPLRSKANAVINLMGAAGGIIVLGLGAVFGTGRAANALMSYTPFFSAISGLMLVSLVIFLWKVKEPQLVREMHEESRRYGIATEEDAAASESQSGNFGITNAAKKMPHHHGKAGRHAAGHYHPQSILRRIQHRIIGSTEEPEQRFHESIAADRIQCGDDYCSVKAERADLFGFFAVPLPHKPGYKASAADAEQIGKRGKYKEKDI